MNNFLLFITIFIKELFTHKWFKAGFGAFLTVLLVYNKEWLINQVQGYPYGVFGILFLIYFLRLFIPELIPKEAFLDAYTRKVDLQEFLQNKNITKTIAPQRGNKIFEAGIQWKFDPPLPIHPTITIEKIKFKSATQSLYKNTDLKIPSEFVASPPYHNIPFHLKFHFNGTLPEFPLREIEELEIYANALPFKENSFYYKFLAFFSIKLKTWKTTKWFC